MINKPAKAFILDLTENEGKSISLKELPYTVHENLGILDNIFSRLVSINRDPSGQNLFFKAGSNVGVIHALGLRVQVRPKLSVGEFLTLIRYALNGQITSEGIRSYANLGWNIGFENALCTLLCEEIRIILRNGISRRYQERLDSLEVIRGRIPWEKNFPLLSRKSKEIVCQYNQLTYNNIDNQITVSGLKRAFFLASVPIVKRQIGRFLNIFRAVTSERPITLSDFQKAKKGYSRLNDHYHVAHSLTRMLLYNIRPEDFFKPGTEEVFGVVLDMAEIFELFVERFMGDLLRPKGFSLASQPRDSRALIDGDGYRYANVQPDIEVWRGDKAIGIIDAKYKEYWATAENGFNPARKISNEDLYQVFFYQQRMQRRYGLPSLPAALIASPLPAEDERVEKLVIPERFWRVRFHAGVGNDGDVRLALIPVTRFLRLLNRGMASNKAVSCLQEGLDSSLINWPR